jgi:hypothetical protein
MDISSEEHKRIYGRKWLEFLANSRATLGVEAGASIFDIDNTIIPQYQQMVAKNPEITFEEVYDQLLFQYDGQGIYYRTISPRVFEAAAVHTCQILFEGKYSDILKPMVHYIPLQKDFSNFDDVIKMYRDKSFRRELTSNAYRDLIVSGHYSYKHFIETFDESLMKIGLDSEVDNQDAQKLTAALSLNSPSMIIKVRMKYFKGIIRKRAGRTKYIIGKKYPFFIKAESRIKDLVR